MFRILKTHAILSAFILSAGSIAQADTVTIGPNANQKVPGTVDCFSKRKLEQKDIPGGLHA